MQSIGMVYQHLTATMSDDSLDYEDMLYDDYSNETNVECY